MADHIDVSTLSADHKKLVYALLALLQPSSPSPTRGNRGSSRNLPTKPQANTVEEANDGMDSTLQSIVRKSGSRKSPIKRQKVQKPTQAPKLDSDSDSNERKSTSGGYNKRRRVQSPLQDSECEPEPEPDNNNMVISELRKKVKELQELITKQGTSTASIPREKILEASESNTNNRTENDIIEMLNSPDKAISARHLTADTPYEVVNLLREHDGFRKKTFAILRDPSQLSRELKIYMPSDINNMDDDKIEEVQQALKEKKVKMAFTFLGVMNLPNKYKSGVTYEKFNYKFTLL